MYLRLKETGPCRIFMHLLGRQFVQIAHKCLQGKFSIQLIAVEYSIYAKYK